MSVRLIECYRVLKQTGSLYLHCDPTMTHYLKIVLDCIFGEKMFRNEIVWGYERPRNANKIWHRNHDIIFLYTKTDNYDFTVQRVLKIDGSFEMRKPFIRPDGTVW